MHKLFEMLNQEFEAQERKYQVLPNFGICCLKIDGLEVTSFCACMRSICSDDTPVITGGWCNLNHGNILQQRTRSQSET